MKTNRLTSTCLTLLACLPPFYAQATSIIWTNTAGGNWGLPVNWSSHEVPGASDTAYITNIGTYTVTLNVNAAVAGLVLGARSGLTSTIQTLTNYGQTLTLNGPATVTTNGAFSFVNGVLAGATALSGTMNVQTATLNSGASLTVSATGLLNIVGAGLFAIEGPMTNNGTVNWLGGTVQVVNDNNVQYKGAIWNRPGAQWFIECNSSMADDVGTGYEIFNNAGLLCKTNVAGTTTCTVYLNNTGGTTQAQIGTLDLQNGCNLAGVFQAAAGAAINFTAGNYVWNGTAVFEGPGSVAITGGSVIISVSLTSPFSASGVILSNVSNLKGSAYLTNITIAGAESVAGTNITGDGITLQPSGSLTVIPNGLLNIVGAGPFAIEGPMTNNGTVNWLGGTVQVVNDNNVQYKGAIWNRPGAQWFIECNSSMADDVGTGYEIFNNAGLLCKTNVAGTTTCTVYLNNTGGTTQAQIGTLDLQNGCNLAGVFQAAAGAAINFTAGNYVWNGTAVFEGPGSVAITGGSVIISVSLTSPFSASGVILSNVSNLKGSAYLTNITIAGAESVAGTNITGDGITLQPSGSLTITPNGLLNIVGAGPFAIEGPMTNNGTVNWLGGTVQVVNDNNVQYKGAIWNRPGAQWFIECNSSMADDVGTGYEIFNNAGLLCKTNVAGGTTFSVGLNNTTGTVDAEIGLLSFASAYNFGAGGTTSFGLSSLSSFGTITLAGTASLDGALNVHLNNGYAPAVSNAFTLLSYNAFAGNFSRAALPSGSWRTVEAAKALTVTLVSSQPPTLPSLSIVRHAPNVVISWTTNSSGFVLNKTASLASPVAWTPVTNTIAVSGTNNMVTVNPSSGSQYYALIAP